jgi:nucleoside-diphosphate-sugar epimerase
MLRAMKVMVLGATGFIGPAVVARLQARGHEALPVSRHGEIRVDRSDPDAMARLAGEQKPDAVIDLLAMTVEGTRPLLDTLAGRTGRYVLASSGDVYRQYGALQRKQPAERLERIPEDAPLRTMLHPYRSEPRRPAEDPQAWMDDYDKIPVERAALGQAGLPAVVVRLPMVYGPGDRQRRFGWTIGPMLAGRPVIEVDAAWAAWRSSYGYVDDVAHGLALAAVHPAAAGRTYNVGPLEAPDHAGWAARFAQALGWTGELKPIERSAVPVPLRQVLDGLDLTYPLVTDTSRIRSELGYAEATDPDEALRRTIADELSRGA